jgi:hypothetical protein
MIIPFGVSIWRSGPGWLPNAPIRWSRRPGRPRACVGYAGSRPSIALIGEVDVWRAANGIDHKDHRPTGAGQLKTASALWQHHLDRSVANCSDHLPTLDARGRQPASSDRWHEDQQRVTQPPAVRTSSPPGVGL